MKSLRLVHLYPDLMNLYGDRGNIIVLKQRCAWRGIELRVDEVGLGGELTGDYDLAFIGGGQDREQLLVYEDLLGKSESFSGMIANGLVVLAVCGGYQLLGHRFITYEGAEIQGLGVLDVSTVGGGRRLIGNVIARADVNGQKRLLIGFENHSGRTTLGSGAQPLALVQTGFGNNGDDRTEGARQGNVFGTYLHGSLLPKNPWFADHLIGLCLKRKYGDECAPAPLDDRLEAAAQAAVVKRIEALGRRRWVPAWFKK